MELIKIAKVVLTCTINDVGSSKDDKSHCIGCQDSSQKNIRKFSARSHYDGSTIIDNENYNDLNIQNNYFFVIFSTVQSKELDISVCHVF